MTNPMATDETATIGDTAPEEKARGPVGGPLGGARVAKALTRVCWKILSMAQFLHMSRAQVMTVIAQNRLTEPEQRSIGCGLPTSHLPQQAAGGRMNVLRDAPCGELHLRPETSR